MRLFSQNAIQNPLAPMNAEEARAWADSERKNAQVRRTRANRIAAILGFPLLALYTFKTGDVSFCFPGFVLWIVGVAVAGRTPSRFRAQMRQLCQSDSPEVTGTLLELRRDFPKADAALTRLLPRLEPNTLTESEAASMLAALDECSLAIEQGAFGLPSRLALAHSIAKALSCEMRPSDFWSVQRLRRSLERHATRSNAAQHDVQHIYDLTTQLYSTLQRLCQEDRQNLLRPAFDNTSQLLRPAKERAEEASHTLLRSNSSSDSL